MEEGGEEAGGERKAVEEEGRGGGGQRRRSAVRKRAVRRSAVGRARTARSRARARTRAEGNSSLLARRIPGIGEWVMCVKRSESVPLCSHLPADTFPADDGSPQAHIPHTHIPPAHPLIRPPAFLRPMARPEELPRTFRDKFLRYAMVCAWCAARDAAQGRADRDRSGRGQHTLLLGGAITPPRHSGMQARD